MVSYMTVLSWEDYSYVMPAGAFGYALLTLMAVVFLHETVSARRWIGVVLICLGVLLVGETKPRTTAVASEAAAWCARFLHWRALFFGATVGGVGLRLGR